MRRSTACLPSSRRAAACPLEMVYFRPGRADLTRPVGPAESRDSRGRCPSSSFEIWMRTTPQEEQSSTEISRSGRCYSLPQVASALALARVSPHAPADSMPRRFSGFQLVSPRRYCHSPLQPPEHVHLPVRKMLQKAAADQPSDILPVIVPF